MNEEPYIWLNYIITLIGPLIAFFVGVVISDRLGLYAELKRKHVYFMSVPVALVTVGILISSATVTVEDITKYGYTESVGSYMTFCGVIMFYGTLVPEIFEIYRKKIRPAS